MILRKLPINKKLTVIIMVASIAGLLFASLVMLLYDRYTLKEVLVEEANVLAKVVADRSTAAILFDDKNLGAENLRALGLKSSVEMACIYGRNGMLFTGFTPANYGKNTCPVSAEPINSIDRSHLWITAPVEIESEQLGKLYMLVSLEQIDTRLAQYIRFLLPLILVVSVFVLLLSRRLQELVSVPILHLTRVARTVADHKDYSVRASKQSDDEVGLLVDAFNEMLDKIAVRETERDQAEQELFEHREKLEQLVSERTAKLESTNRELEAFSYSVSHDLRAPLRAITGFSSALLEDYGQNLDEAGNDYLRRVVAACTRMNHLIEDLLGLSRMTRQEMIVTEVDVSGMAKAVGDQILADESIRDIVIEIEPDIKVRADEHLLRIAVENLMGNAVKYTRYVTHTKIQFGTTCIAGEKVFYLRDNGAGFDMLQAGKLFGPFQRLHSAEEFQGTGIGLATVARIIHRHGGRIWAEGEVDQGATFYFTLGSK